MWIADNLLDHNTGTTLGRRFGSWMPFARSGSNSTYCGGFVSWMHALNKTNQLVCIVYSSQHTIDVCSRCSSSIAKQIPTIFPHDPLATPSVVAISAECAWPVSDNWPIDEDVAELLTQSSMHWRAIPLKPLLVLKGHPGSPHFSHTQISPTQLKSVLKGAIVVAQFVVNHHRFSAHHSFTTLFNTVYVLQAGPDAPETMLSLIGSRALQGVCWCKLSHASLSTSPLWFFA